MLKVEFLVEQYVKGGVLGIAICRRLSFGWSNVLKVELLVDQCRDCGVLGRAICRRLSFG